MKYLVAVLILCSYLSAQTAKVYELSPSAVEEVRQKYADKIVADATWDQLVADLKDEINIAYPNEKVSDIEFSENFKFIVPAKSLNVDWCFNCRVCPTIPLICAITSIPAGTMNMNIVPGTYETWIDSITPRNPLIYDMSGGDINNGDGGGVSYPNKRELKDSVRSH